MGQRPHVLDASPLAAEGGTQAVTRIVRAILHDDGPLQHGADALAQSPGRLGLRVRAGKTQLRGTSREGHTANRRRGWIGKLRSTTTQRAEGTARLITTIAVIVALIGGAGPAAAQVLVTNFSELSTGGQALGDFDFAQPFTTGTNASGYQLESISINFLIAARGENQ